MDRKNIALVWAFFSVAMLLLTFIQLLRPDGTVTDGAARLGVSIACYAMARIEMRGA